MGRNKIVNAKWGRTKRNIWPSCSKDGKVKACKYENGENEKMKCKKETKMDRIR